MRRAASIALAALVALAAASGTAGAQSETLAPPVDFQATTPANDDGTHIDLTWKARKDAPEELEYLLFRSPYGPATAPPAPPADAQPGDWIGAWQLIAITTDGELNDDVTNDYVKGAPGRDLVWGRDDQAAPAADAKAGPPEMARAGYWVYAIRAASRTDDRIEQISPAVMAGPAVTKTSYFHTGKWFYAAVVLLMGLGLLYYFRTITRNPEAVFIRRIAGVDAIEDAVGRSTEMGRPVLYVTGTDDVQNIQTIASLLVLGRVAEMAAEYDTEIKVANLYPLTMVVAEEIVRQGFADAGRIDAHKPENVMFISSEQFAFAAGVNGLILRDRPATNIYLGRYFAESLILAETGYVTGAVQIAGTAEIPQLPFFIAACDYTLIGEELYAVSAYLTREPKLLAQLKSIDMLKLIIMILIIAGMLGNLIGFYDLREVMFP